MKKPRISIVVAVSEAREIGKSNLVGQLLWYIPEDLKRFKSITMGHPVVMGRKTYESVVSYIGNPYPGRTSIVITRDKNYDPGFEGVIVVDSLEKGIEEAKKAPGSDEIFIGGGGQIYNQAIKHVDRLYLTLVEGKYDADILFPDYSDFTKVLSEEKKETSDGLKFTWLTLERE